jgi:hypothetical protein
MALLSAQWADILDRRFIRIWDERFTNQPDRIGDFYNIIGGTQQVERFSTAGTLPAMPRFLGTVSYSDASQGYDTTLTPLEFAQGVQIERRLHDDGMFNIIENKPKALAGTLFRLRQTHAARPFVRAFAVDTFFYSNSEGVPLGSNSHTTTSGASTATGFDNLTTASLTSTAVAAARIQMLNFRGDQGERISNMPDALVVPPDLAEAAFEITSSRGKPDTANNDANFNFGRYRVIEWNELTDANNWFMINSGMMKDFGLIWDDRVKGEFAFVEDFDKLIGKWRAYARHGNAWVDWRWFLGGSVS